MKRKQVVTLALGAVIVVLLAVIGVLGWKYQQASKVSSTDKSKETSVRIIQQVSSLYIVPTGEEPTVAQIQDKTKLGNQDFFKKAQNGDYLLVYQKEKVALIYREKDNKLVNVGPVNVDGTQDQQGETAGAETQSDTPTAP